MKREHYERIKKLQAAGKLIADECLAHEDCYEGEYECPFFKFDEFGTHCQLAVSSPGSWAHLMDWIDKEEVSE